MGISDKLKEWYHATFGQSLDEATVRCSCDSPTYDPRNEVIYNGRTRREIDDENSRLVDIISRPILIPKR